jgi:hypothetical protein
MANFEYRDDTVALHPKALWGGGYNSNTTALEDDERPDSFMTVIIGCDLDWMVSDESALKLDAELDSQDYFEENQLDIFGGRGGLSFARKGREWAYDTDVRYARINDPFPRTGQQIERQTIDAVADLDHQGRVSLIGVGAFVNRVDFLEPTDLFDAEQYDHTRYGVSAHLGLETARESEIYNRTAVSTTVFDTNEIYQDSDDILSVLGWRFRSSTRTRMTLEAGLEYRRYDDHNAFDPDGELSILQPIGAVRFIWPWEEGSQVALDCSSRLVDGLVSNIAIYTSAELSGRLRIRKQTFLTAGAALLILDETDAPPNREEEKRTTIRYEAGAEYFLRDGVGIRWRNFYSESESEILNDFQRYYTTLELGVAF